MLQGDHQSLLFNIFIDSLVRKVNVSSSRGLVSLFVHDVISLARYVQIMQNLFNSCADWSDGVHMA